MTRSDKNLARATRSSLPTTLPAIATAASGILLGAIGLDSTARFALWPDVAYVSMALTAAVACFHAVAKELENQLIVIEKDERFAARISDFMYRWIDNSSRVAIFSRDLTWGEEPRLRGLLMKKARELVICMEHTTDLANDLADAGAEVLIYGKEINNPSMRFTIQNYGNMASAAVAIGRAKGEVHEIRTIGAGGDPAFYIAQDLVDLVRATGTRVLR